MRSFIASSTIFLAVTSTLAAPFNSTLHFLNKRDAVCGADFRSLVDKSSCIPTGVHFAFTPPSAITEVKLTDDDKKKGPKGAQCDHLVELQLLDFVAKESKICDIIKALTAADKTQAKKTLLQKASADISALKNLNFLDAKVNNRKKTIIQRSLSNTKPEDEDLDKAVGNFLKLVGSDGTSVAGTLDADLLAIKTTAEASLAKLKKEAQDKQDKENKAQEEQDKKNQAKGKKGGKGQPKKPASTRPSRDKDAAARNELEAAIKSFDSKVTVTEEWKKVLAAAPHS